MTFLDTSATRRADRLLRWYPRTWRDRYGEEFRALLECELEERPRSPRIVANVAWSGAVARASSAGLAGLLRDEDQQVRSSLAWLAGAVVAFLAFGLAMWSQLVVGWQWARPRTADTTGATVVMSIAVGAFLVVGALAVLPIAASVVASFARGRGRRLVLPVATLLVAVAVLVVGAHDFQNGWPGTGGHHWAHQGLVPGGFAAFVWASTLGVTSYWAHPSALAHFPTSEVVWMVLSPLAIVTSAIAAAITLRRLDLADRVARFELRVGQAALAVMGLFVVGATLWLSSRPPGGPEASAILFRVGVIDVIGVVVMVAALLFARQALTRGLRVRR